MKNGIRFLLNHRETAVDFKEDRFNPNTTLLNYLRSHPDLRGVKEGCAEGDCGACTVVIAEVEKGKLVYRAYDSCLIFLPQINGKHVITVEGLGNSANLHYVQEAMVELHASQCGFCTPGFVMSMFALAKNYKSPSKDQILDSFAGNLCRCTGYRPIIEAAEMACRNSRNDDFDAKEEETIKILNEIQQEKESVSIVFDDYTYFMPRTLKEALSILNTNTGAIILNGNTDIGLRVTKRKEKLKSIVDLSAIGELKEVKLTASGLECGSGCTLEDLRISSEKMFPALYKMLSVFGSRQIRNKATIGGNIGSASPIGDTIPILMAANAELVLISQSGNRKVQLRDYITGYRQTVIKTGELIEKILIPAVPEGFILESYKVSKRKDLDISTVSAAFLLKVKKGRVEAFEAFYGGMAAFTKSATLTSRKIRGEKWSLETVTNAIEFLSQDFSPISDARCGEEARMLMAGNLLLKFYNDTKDITG